MDERDWQALLDRELYWRADATGDLHGATVDLRVRLGRLADALREDLDRGVPVHEPTLRQGRGWRRALKRLLFRLFRPVTRRGDRVAAELAGMTADLVDRLSQTQLSLQRLDAELDALRRRSETPEPGAARRPTLTRWSFAPAAEERREELTRYASIAQELRADDERPPLWIDLGSGRGELLGLLEGWGWRALGVEEEALEGSAIEAEPVRFLLGYEQEPPAVISAIGLLEHLPVDRWADLFRGAQRVLRAGGALLVETLDAADPKGLAGFFADPTITRPARREAVAVLASDAGFSEVVDLATGGEGVYAVLARV